MCHENVLSFIVHDKLKLSFERFENFLNNFLSMLIHIQTMTWTKILNNCIINNTSLIRALLWEISNDVFIVTSYSLWQKFLGSFLNLLLRLRPILRNSRSLWSGLVVTFNHKIDITILRDCLNDLLIPKYVTFLIQPMRRLASSQLTRCSLEIIQ
jgi:hypothetical protein